MKYLNATACSLLVPVLLTTACSHENEPLFASSADTELRAVVAEKGLTGDPTAGRDLPDVNGKVAQLGKKLFFSKGLGGDQDAACVTCHHPMLGGGDNLSLSIGVEAEVPDLLGPGRRHSSAGNHFDGGPTVPRNAPTTFNIALWDSVMFHDGRIESLTGTAGTNGADSGIRTPDSPFGVADPQAGDNLTMAQSRFPVTSAEEMRGFGFYAGQDNNSLRSGLELRFQGADSPLALVVNDWLAEFQLAFDEPNGEVQDVITFDRITHAIAAYENSQVFVDTPWKAYVEGNNVAISEQAKQGASLFFNDYAAGGANCASCHSGDFFTDENFHVLAMPQIGRGKGNDNSVTTNDDFGRFRETGESIDKYAFRTPALLNVGVTGPWSHAGAYTSLEAVVRHHLNPQQALDDYDFSQLTNDIQVNDMRVNTQFAVDQLEANRAVPLPSVENVALSDLQVDQLLEFLKTLTDPCVKDRACMADWLPGDADSDPDTLRTFAIDQDGREL